jgi:hypothetical protein
VSEDDAAVADVGGDEVVREEEGERCGGAAHIEVDATVVRQRMLQLGKDPVHGRGHRRGVT